MSRTSVKEAERLACQLVPFFTAGTLIYDFREFYPTDASFIRDTTEFLREAGKVADGIVSYAEELAEDEDFGGIVLAELVGAVKDYIKRRRAELAEVAA